MNIRRQMALASLVMLAGVISVARAAESGAVASDRLCSTTFVWSRHLALVTDHDRRFDSCIAGT
jgi:hypothetical protein